MTHPFQTFDPTQQVESNCSLELWTIRPSDDTPQSSIWSWSFCVFIPSGPMVDTPLHSAATIHYHHYHFIYHSFLGPPTTVVRPLTVSTRTRLHRFRGVLVFTVLIHFCDFTFLSKTGLLIAKAHFCPCSRYRSPNHFKCLYPVTPAGLQPLTITYSCHLLLQVSRVFFV